jgi:hypothetical protein
MRGVRASLEQAFLFIELVSIARHKSASTLEEFVAPLLQRGAKRGERLALTVSDFDEIAFACFHFGGQLATNLPRGAAPEPPPVRVCVSGLAKYRRPFQRIQGRRQRARSARGRCCDVAIGDSRRPKINCRSN